MFAVPSKARHSEGKILSLKPATPTLTCQQCHAIGDGSDICQNCGTQFSPLDRETYEPTAAAPKESAAPAVSGDGTIYSSSPEASTSSWPPQVYHPIFWGQGKTLFGIFIVNTFLTLLTLGVYSFWGRVRIRQFLSSQTSLARIRFSYHGTGMELLKGWSKAFLVFGVPYAFLSFVPIIWGQIPSWIPETLAAIMLLGFIPIAVVGSHRYRLSRTAFGSIRFSFRGRVKDYMRIWFTGTFLTVLTAGLYYPFFENTRREFLVSHTYLGNQHFTYNGGGTGVLAIYVKSLGIVLLIFLGVVAGLVKLTGIPLDAEVITHFMSWLKEHQENRWLLIILLGGIFALIVPWFYLQVSKQRYFWNHSTFGKTPFQFTASTWNLIELRLTNFLMLVLTFGLAWPWIQVRNLQFLYYYLGLQGPIDIYQVEQEALDASPTGEELASYFDAGFDLG